MKKYIAPALKVVELENDESICQTSGSQQLQFRAQGADDDSEYGEGEAFVKGHSYGLGEEW